MNIGLLKSQPGWFIEDLHRGREHFYAARQRQMALTKEIDLLLGYSQDIQEGIISLWERGIHCSIFEDGCWSMEAEKRGFPHRIPLEMMPEMFAALASFIPQDEETHDYQEKLIIVGKTQKILPGRSYRYVEYGWMEGKLVEHQYKREWHWWEGQEIATRFL